MIQKTKACCPQRLLSPMKDSFTASHYMIKVQALKAGWQQSNLNSIFCYLYCLTQLTKLFLLQSPHLQMEIIKECTS